MNTIETDRLAGAKAQGQAQFDSIREMVVALEGWEAAADLAGWKPFTDKFGVPCWRDESDGMTFAGTARQLCEDQGIEPETDAARERIQEDALSVEVRTDWYDPTRGCSADTKPAAYRILLCTGGPAVQIVGELSEYGEPETARMQVQDWFQPWTDFRPQVAKDDYDAEPTLLAYARCFYFGE